MLPDLPSPDSSNLRIPRWWAMSIALLITAAFIVAGWYEGHRSGTLQQRRWASELLQLTQELAATKLAYETERKQLQAATAALRSSGKDGALQREQQLRRQLLRTQADAEACKEIIDRQQLSLASQLSMISTLAQRNVKLLPMKGSDTAASSIAYAVLVPNTKLIFVGSDLPELSPDKQLQLWLIRKQQPKLVSAGVVTPTRRTAVLQLSNPALVSEIDSIAVTEEPFGGSPAPTGPKLLVADVSSNS